MSDFPSPSLVSRVESLILEIFDVSTQEAHNHASGLAALAEDWGSPEKAARLDWSYRVKKDLGMKLRWRSDAERKKFESDQQERFRAYDALIKTKYRA
jgi:hypothetical protein